MPQMTIKLHDRRKQCLDLHYSGMDDGLMIREVAKSHGPNIKAVRQDWYRRDHWEPVIWRMEQSAGDVARLLYKLRLGQESALYLMRHADNDNAKVGAIGKLAYLISREIELRQSLGDLPKVAEKLDINEQIEERVTLNVSDNEDEILSKAASILDRKLRENRRREEEPQSIH